MLPEYILQLLPHLNVLISPWKAGLWLDALIDHLEEGFSNISTSTIKNPNVFLCKTQILLYNYRKSSYSMNEEWKIVDACEKYYF